MALKLFIPSGNPDPSIEVYKLALRRLENAIVNRCIEIQTSNSPNNTNTLCTRCAVVGERLKEACEDNDGAQEIDLGGSARDASGNLHLGTLPEIFAQEDCVLCCLITRQFLRTNRREIYINSLAKNVQLHGLTLVELLGLGYPDDDVGIENERQWIIDPFEQVLQCSLNTILSDGIISIWWPEKAINEVNDDATQLPMLAADHKALLSGGLANPWFPLPRGKLNSQRHLDMFSNCFRSCLQNHTKCRETSISASFGLGFGPSRLIDIEEMRIVRMEIDEIPPYFVLSYVWGHPPFLLLETRNESAFSTLGFLATQKIPQTISDAIEVTRQFGVRYLWVDALCIVQDDLENKMHEIDRMHIIYAQAFLTIVAATGDNAHSNLLDINPVFTDQEEHLINETRFTVDAMEMREVVEFSTWFTRGWTFQELVFSRRVLYFTPERTYYSCEEGSWSEDFPFSSDSFCQGLKFSEDYSHYNIGLQVYQHEHQNQQQHHFNDESLKSGFNFHDRYLDKRNPFDNYTSMVSSMSSRNFTKESDCLNACRGFYTGILLKGLGGSVCGLPAICFEFALMWQADGTLTRKQISGDDGVSQFPSWSWAGWKGRIEHPFLSNPEKCGVRGEVRWSVFEVYCGMNGGVRYKQIIPTIKVHTSPEQSYESLTSWQSHSEGTRSINSKARALIDVEQAGEISTRRIMSTNFIGPSILVFETDSIICQIREGGRPLLAKHQDLKFFSIYPASSSSSSFSSDDMIGELKIDTITLNTFLDSNTSHLTSPSSSSVSGDPITLEIELISLSSLDFGSQAIQELLWMNEHSARGTFSKEFREMVDKMRGWEKKMKAVMWIARDEEGIARRVSVGFVSLEGWKSAGPMRREVVLG